MLKHPSRIRFFNLGIMAFFIACCWVQPSFAQEKRDSMPQRLVTMGVEYPGVTIPLNEDIEMDIIFHNRGKSDENVLVWIAEKPEKWKAEIKTYKFAVTGAHIASGEDKRLTFEANPEKDVPPGKYEFRIDWKTSDDTFSGSQAIFVTLTDQSEKNSESRGIELTTSYPVLKGPSDGQFEFSMEVENKLDKDTMFDLFSKGPDGWDINFKPAYEDKYISSLRLKSNENKTVAVVVKPTSMARAGDYPVNIRVSAGKVTADAELTVTLTGTYALEVGTPSGLLSLDARAGKPANLSIYVKNEGSAVSNDIKFMSFKPENWKVEFKPETIPAIEPGELKQVEVTITPGEEALVGDYSVNVRVEGEKVNKPIEFRVTVKASSAWGWVGIGIIVLVIAGLSALFRKLGRR